MGRKAVPKSDRSGSFVTIASGFEGDKDALPDSGRHWRAARPTLKAGESAEYAPGKTRNLYLVPAAGAWKSTAFVSTRVTASQSATKHGSRSPRWRIPNWCWSTRREQR